jgi:4-amino-4-deoxy-L-arabinose transferase-like glycosyltransferase
MAMPKRLDSHQLFLLLFCVAFLSFFVNLGGAPLFDEDEGTYSEVTREMLENRDFVHPKFNGKPFFHKPPMLYWTQAVSVSGFGLNEFALRLPSALAAMIWSVWLFAFTRRHLESPVAWYAVFFMVTSLQTGIIAKAAIPDGLLNLFITAAMFTIFKYYLKPGLKYICAAYLFMALGFLTKGPIAILIPLVSSALFFGIKKRWKSLISALFHPIGWGIFLLIVMPWYLALYMEYGRSFWDEIFLIHNVARFQTAFEGHAGPLFYYLPVILLGMLPHTAFLIKALTGIRTYLKNELNLFLFFWFGFVFVFFSMAGTKLHHYIVYGYVPLFIFMAQAAEDIRKPVNQFIWPVAFLLVFFFLPEIAKIAQPLIKDDFASLVLAGARPYFGLKHRLMVGLVLLTAALMPFVSRFSGATRTILTGTLFMALVNFYAVPLAGSIMQQPVKEAALLSKKNGYQVVMWGASYPSFAVYREEIISERQPKSGDIIITKMNKLNRIRRHQIIYQKNGIVLTRVLEP